MIYIYEGGNIDNNGATVDNVPILQYHHFIKQKKKKISISFYLNQSNFKK